MPPLEPYSASLDYTYALGLYPALEALTRAPERVRRVLLSKQLNRDAAYEKLTALCDKHKIRTETADRLLRRLSGKDNCFAAAAVSKHGEEPNMSAPRHLVLHNPMDMGNAGTILRTALGFGFEDIAIISPALDIYDPRVVRASMGALFSLRVGFFESMDDYLSRNSGRQLYLFMLDSAAALSEINPRKDEAPVSLVFGNEGSGLPAEFASLGTPVRIEQGEAIDSLNLAIAAGIGMYAFRRV
ncbi:MAG: TrmH family RNA methyltransferase [Eubacteriales bacterium]|nr:TrmH family RNA methyltransferase [Eubacteriales bacterium]